jgi:hypothetical protein
MILVGLLTLDQKNDIFEMLFDEDSFFNPVQDADDNWIISQEEIDFCTVEEFQWVKQLPLIEFKPKDVSLT